MSLITEQPFSYRELRSIVSVGTSKESLFKMADAVHTLLTNLRQNPDAEWTQLEELFDSQLPHAQITLLRDTYDRHKAQRDAITKWQQQIDQDPQRVIAEVRRQCSIPETIEIKRVEVASNELVIFLDNSDLNELFSIMSERRGVKRKVGVYEVGGFVSRFLYVKSRKGDPISILAVCDNNDGQRTKQHESTHAAFGRFYLRTKNEQPEPLTKPLRSIIGGDIAELVAVLPSPISCLLVRSKILQMLRSIAFRAKLTFFDELVAYVAEGDHAKADFYAIADLMKTSLSPMSSDTKYYGEFLEEVAVGFHEALDQLDIQPSERLRLRYEVELAIAQVYSEAQVMAKWYHKLWDSVNHDTDRFVSILLAIPYKYRTSVAYFLNREPKEIENEIQKRAQYYDVQRSIVSRLCFVEAKRDAQVALHAFTHENKQQEVDNLVTEYLSQSEAILDTEKFWNWMNTRVIAFYRQGLHGLAAAHLVCFRSVFEQLRKLAETENSFSYFSMMPDEDRVLARMVEVALPSLARDSLCSLVRMIHSSWKRQHTHMEGVSGTVLDSLSAIHGDPSHVPAVASSFVINSRKCQREVFQELFPGALQYGYIASMS